MTEQDTNAVGAEFTQYRRKQIAELRPWQMGDNMERVSISAPDKEAGSPKAGDMIARNPKNHDDQWLVAAAYFADNFEPAAALTGTVQPVAVAVAAVKPVPTVMEFFGLRGDFPGTNCALDFNNIEVGTRLLDRIRIDVTDMDALAPATLAVPDRLYDDKAPMADGEIKMTAAEDVLAWLLIEKIGAPDDTSYSPADAQATIANAIDRLHEYEAAPATLAVAGDVVERLEALIPHTFEKDGDGYYDTPLTFAVRDAIAALCGQSSLPAGRGQK